MGLDIYLLKIVDNPKSERDWLTEEDNPELKAEYSSFLKTRQKIDDYGNRYTEYGYYYEEISYQRKGVKSIFTKEFKSDDFVFTLDRFDVLKKCIDKKHKESFEKDFISKFKEKENFILICY
ncbi:hypothetical protein BWZ20_02285 [Winogradskyella sp. J14-2]|uniref:hypothetical protein n=1 Tax=Winogradskyella sp. J14-2 TaxID=1936080 RepID=UPI0009726C30|nr:hypothetical protein [Winogradskyella sp. J14-2]APY07203.1 hypothetical protein BWZ20_02285 [Winogradskyella sp. J14-2]